MNRREFIGKSIMTSAGTIAGLTILNNLELPDAAAHPITGGDIREIPLVLQDTPELQNVGGMYHMVLDDLEKEILVVRLGDDTFDAVDIKCPHKGCEVALDSKMMKKFTCPCHGSEFSLKGEVLNGPAKKNLTWYETNFKDGTVTVKVPMNAQPSAPGDSTQVKPDSTMMKKDSTLKK
jgi:Rieske Fe-S protein